MSIWQCVQEMVLPIEHCLSYRALCRYSRSSQTLEIIARAPVGFEQCPWREDRTTAFFPFTCVLVSFHVKERAISAMSPQIHQGEHCCSGPMVAEVSGSFVRMGIAAELMKIKKKDDFFLAYLASVICSDISSRGVTLQT